jgi:hypothetical protein
LTIYKRPTERVTVIRNLLHLESGMGMTPPALQKIKSGKDTINIRVP